MPQSLDLAQIEAIVKEIEQEKEAGAYFFLVFAAHANIARDLEAERKRSRLAATAAGQAAMAQRADTSAQ